MDIVTVKTFDNYFSANIILTRLHAEGVECYLKDETTITIDPILTNAIGGIKLIVKKENARFVRRILQRFEEEYINAATCPKCKAHDFTYLAKPGVTNFLTAILTTLFASYAVAPEYVYRCGNCRYETVRLPNFENDEQD